MTPPSGSRWRPIPACTAAIPLADPARLARIFAAAGITPEDATRRMQDALPVLRAIHRVEPVLTPDDAIAAAAAFHDEPGFQPLLLSSAPPNAQRPRTNAPPPMSPPSAILTAAPPLPNP